MTVRIAHLSDLHFGMKGQTTVWKSLRTYLLTELKPDLILVSGDIVDTPNDGLFRHSAEELELLRSGRSRCYVCAGNHDRHVQGNAIAGVPRRWRSIAGRIRKLFETSAPRDEGLRSCTTGMSDASSQFDKEFAQKGMLLQLREPAYFEMSSGRLQWKLRLVGLDSSTEARYFAQGHISPEAMQNLRAALNGSGENQDVDVVIVLIHHHLLPIVEIEGSEQTFQGVLSGTTVLNNAGSVLEALARDDADIVLHGHDHARHIARYSSFSARRGDVVVVGAGSATGAHTTLGCDIRRASFNLLELTDDSSVVLREVRNAGPGWEVIRDETNLLSARAIRRARFFRRSPQAAVPESRWIRHFEFTASRDCLIRESLSNWVLDDGSWLTTTVNSSGVPIFVQGEIELPQGRIVPLSGAQSLTPTGGGRYELRHTIPGVNATPIVLRRVDQEIMWVGGATLTEDDLTRCNPGPYRIDKREFIAARVQNGIESLTLALELPRRFRPQNDVFEVIAETSDGKSHHLKELQDRLRVTGRTKVRAAVTIPYPRPGVRYVVSWLVPNIGPIAASLAGARQRLSSLAHDVVAHMDEALRMIFPRENCTVALYLPSVIHERLSFDLLRSNNGNPAPPRRVTPTVNQNAFCAAHWGLPNCVIAQNPSFPDQDEKAAGLLDGEAAIFLLPLVSPFQAGLASAEEESLAVLRVGWLSESAEKVFLPKMVTAANAATRALLPLLED